MTDPLDALYASLTAGRRQTVRDLEPEARRAYQREARKAHRQRQREAADRVRPSRP